MPGVMAALGPSSNVMPTTALPAGYGEFGMSNAENAGSAVAPAGTEPTPAPTTPPTANAAVSTAANRLRNLTPPIPLPTSFERRTLQPAPEPVGRVREDSLGHRGRDRAGEDSERGAQRAVGHHGEDPGFAPGGVDVRPVVVGGPQRPLVPRLEPVAVHVAEGWLD